MSEKQAIPSLSGVRVLFLGTYPPPFGGIASHLKTLIPALLKAGAEEIVVLNFGASNSIEKVDGLTVYRYNLKSNLWRLLLPQYFGLLKHVIKSLGGRGLTLPVLAQELVKAVLTHKVAVKHNATVVSGYMANASLQLIPLASHWRGRRGIVLTVFGEIFEATEFMVKQKVLMLELLTIPQFVLASSRHCANSFLKIGNTRLIEPVFYGVELEGVTSTLLRDEFRASQNFNAEDVVVFFMGRMHNEMGLDVVLETASSLFKFQSTVRLVIAGATGPLTTQAYQLAKHYPENVLVLENVSFPAQRGLYSAADILVAPSFNQRACMGVSIKEAMAARIPVVGGAGGGVPEAVVDGETGFLIPVNSVGAVDSIAYLDAIKRLVRDPELRLRLGNAGRQRAEKVFSVDRTNRRMAEILLATNNGTQ
jgi:glycosyltransferase involved in cell wall biosynthesis